VAEDLQALDQDQIAKQNEKKDIAKILKAIASKDHKVDPWVFHPFNHPARQD
jgi:hypothetical protein